MHTEIIAVGNEVVFGHTVNSNATYIARAVEDIGGQVHRHHAVRDVEKDIKEVVQESIKRSKLIFIIGGLGPTKDDLTKEVVCETLGMPLILYPRVVSDIQERFNKLGKEMTSNNLKQAYFPKECKVLDNPNGTAPGCILQYNECKIILLPGPPRELKPMVEQVISDLKQCTSKVVYTKDIQLFGIGESHVSEQLAHILGQKEDLIVAPYVGNNEVVVRVKAFDHNLDRAKQRVEEQVKQIEACLAQYVIGYNESRLEETVVKQLIAKTYTIATAESCTGGMVASTLINCSGASRVINESIVTYSNAAKEKYLQVQHKTLEELGAVSEAVAREMAEGIKKASGADIGLSTTGIAGPNGGTVQKPVGLIYIGIAMPDKTYVYKLNLVGSRQDVREKTTKYMMYELYKLLK